MQAPNPLPRQCDVLVVGAGPAGSACALWLARAGVDVLLADQHDFPRDKVCGDGLIPDAHAALRRLGVLDEVTALAMHVRHVRCVGPRGGYVDVPGSLSVLPRRSSTMCSCAPPSAPVRGCSRRCASRRRCSTATVWSAHGSRPAAAATRSRHAGSCWPPAQCRRR